MAQALNLNPPKEIDFINEPKKSFEAFEKAYKFYITALGFEGETDKRKTAILLSLAGDEAIKVYETFEWAAAQGTQHAQGEDGYIPAESDKDPQLVLRK